MDAEALRRALNELIEDAINCQGRISKRMIYLTQGLQGLLWITDISIHIKSFLIGESSINASFLISMVVYHIQYI